MASLRSRSRALDLETDIMTEAKGSSTHAEFARGVQLEMEPQLQGAPGASSLGMMQTVGQLEWAPEDQQRALCDAVYKDGDVYDLHGIRDQSSRERRFRGTTLRGMWYWSEDDRAEFDRSAPSPTDICRGCGLYSTKSVLTRQEAECLKVEDPMFWEWSECRVAAALGLRKPLWEEEADRWSYMSDLEAYLLEGNFRYKRSGSREGYRRYDPSDSDGEPRYSGIVPHDERYCHHDFCDDVADTMETSSAGGTSSDEYGGDASDTSDNERWG
jgi:hypothetical protein